MNLVTWLLMALGIVSAPEPVPHRDIPYFVENVEIRRQTLRLCHDDSALASTPTCRNAEAAGALELGRALLSRPRLPEPQSRPVPPVVVPIPDKGGERAA